ncbi:MAG: type I DNA topoisomerase [Rickettsiales bacterium]|nr:type I DNA topoisomerase [Rickettsiales bacterium]MCA0254304.1 type I DNA topoisomerase [Pseudomonadota bacterium]
MKLVIVESPAKAKTINKYLGKDYKVVASFGHVRDLPSKNGSVLPEQNFAMKYEISDKSTKHINEIIKLAKQSDEVYLATDPDREGESISWHIAEILKEKKAIKGEDKFKRVSFNEITKKSVLDAMAHPRHIDQNLVNAQQARRALDYLVGFTLSPILWRKLPGCRSAGRVQSVALRMICEREDEIERFKSQEYWNIKVDVKNSKNNPFTATLTHSYGEKLEKFSIPNEDSANKITSALKGQNFAVSSIQKKQQKRSPAAPFITSSLQQEASRKLGFSTKKTMQVAQKLYEGVEIKGENIGLITYMRTDGVTLSTESIEAIRTHIKAKYGPDYLPSSARLYKSKSKNAQEAHEAIRPTDISLSPEIVAHDLDKDQLKLYELIWKRTVACQMESAIIDMVGVDIISDDKNFIARATGSTVAFDGYYKLYQEGIDDQQDNDENKLLPPLKEAEIIKTDKILPEQHFTEAPPRFSEASLVKRLEELGIGRPSTYSSIISVLQDRQYAELEKKRFYPTNLGRLVTAFLVGFFAKYVEYDFTAELETDLDEIAIGDRNWLKLLEQFWTGFSDNTSKVSEHKISDIIEYVEKSLDYHLFGEEGTEQYKKNKECPTCHDGTLNLKLGKYGSFLACSNYPECNYKKTISKNEEGEESSTPIEDNNRELGQNRDGISVFLKKGPYGWYVQLGQANSKTDKPKRVQLPAGVKPDSVELGLALNLLNLPMVIGRHSETDDEICIGIGKFGPYIKYQNKFTSIPKSFDLFSISASEAEGIIASKTKKK